MADEIKQLAFKEFTETEIAAGTRWDALTTNGTTHYVIKSIEGSQGYNPDAIEATATIGLTTDFNNNKFSTLGACAKKDRVGLSGSAIMDANSTLSIRPIAKTISYRDQRFQLSRINSTNAMSRVQQHNIPLVNNVQDTFTVNTDINKSSVTFASPQAMQPYPDNYTIFHTNANGVELRIMFFNGNTSSCGFELHNASDGTRYGYYSTSYGFPHFDGERYIYFMRSGSYDHQVCFFDLDKSDLSASATQGGASGQNFFHGAWVYSGNQQISSPTTYDNRKTAFYYDRYLDKKFLIVNSESNARTVLYEIPTTTPTHDYNNVGPKWIWIRLNNLSSGTDPFGNNAGNTWSLGFFMNSYVGTNSHMKLTYDPVKGNYLIFLSRSNNAESAVCKFTREEYDTTASESLIAQGSSTNHGLLMLAYDSMAEVGIDVTTCGDIGSGNYTLRANMNSVIAGWSFGGGLNSFYDGTKMYARHNSNDHLYEVDFSTTGKKATKLDTGLTDSEALTNYNNSFFMGFAVPTSTQKASRTYTIAPKLSVRISGILSDQ